MSTPMQPDYPETVPLHEQELTDADLPASWPDNVREAFWSACAAPTYGEAQRLVLKFWNTWNSFQGRKEGTRA